MMFLALNPRLRIGLDVPTPQEGRVQWRYRNGSLSGHGSWIPVSEAEEVAALRNVDFPQINHWVERR